MISISVCMIVKNEEAKLGVCLDSLKKIADEIIIVDTGSTDKTKEIARAYTDKIYDFQWDDDFAMARNFSFSKATMDYIYTADADEILDSVNQERFLCLKVVLLLEIDVVQMKYSNQLHYGTTYNFDEEYRPKLFKRLREFKWIDAIHESVNIEPIIYDSDVIITHMPDENHGPRDFLIFQKIIQRGERLSKKLVQLYARELYIVGTKEDFLQSMSFFESLTEDEQRGLDEIKDAQCIAARAKRLNKDYIGFFKYSLKRVVDNPCSEICFELGEYYYEHKDYKEACVWYYNAAFETESTMNIHYSGDYPLAKLIKCSQNLDLIDQAEQYKLMLEEYKKQQFITRKILQ